jgi:hypothetical protein
MKLTSNEEWKTHKSGLELRIAGDWNAEKKGCRRQDLFGAIEKPIQDNTAPIREWISFVRRSVRQFGPP